VAIGWDIACGGGAFARHAAVGGAAVAADYAVGGDARARHANDAAARAYLVNHPFTRFAFTFLGQPNAFETTVGAAVGVPGPAPAAQRLENGLTVKARAISGTNEIALVVLYKIGGDHDPPGRSGLAHLVEHLYISSAAGATPARTAEAFAQRYRAGWNAQTGDRYTVFATVFPKDDLEKELADASARMSALRIDAADLEREKPRVRAEVANMFGGIPTLAALNIAREMIRPTPSQGRKGGLPEDVQAITLDDVRAQWARYYKPRNATLILTGAVDETKARQAVSAHFSKLAPGEEIPQPAEPGPAKLGTVREVAVRSLQSKTGPVACLAYAAPEPGSELYAPFLVLVARLGAVSGQPGARAGRPSISFAVLDDPAVFCASVTAKPGETAPQSLARLEAFIASAIAATLRDEERPSARQTFALFLGTTEIPDFALAQNPYGAAFSLARREQLRIDPTALNRAFDALNDRSLRRAADEFFAPSRHAAVFVSPEK
jgi:zinc protease